MTPRVQSQCKEQVKTRIFGVSHVRIRRQFADLAGPQWSLLEVTRAWVHCVSSPSWQGNIIWLLRLPRNRNLVLQRLLRSIPLAFINIPLLGNIIVFTSFVFYLLFFLLLLLLLLLLLFLRGSGLFLCSRKLRNCWRDRSETFTTGSSIKDALQIDFTKWSGSSFRSQIQICVLRIFHFTRHLLIRLTRFLWQIKALIKYYNFYYKI